MLACAWHLLAAVGGQSRSGQRGLPWAADSLCWHHHLASPGQLFDQRALGMRGASGLLCPIPAAGE